MTLTHPCLVCGDDKTAVYRAFCPRCFPNVPWKLRADVMNAYRVRVRHQRLYQETLIALRVWVINDLLFSEELQ